MNIRVSSRSLGVVIVGMVVSAVWAQKPADRSAGAKTGASPDLSGVWRGWVVNGRGDNPDAGTTHLELTIKGNAITARRLDGQRGSLGQGVYQIAPGPAGVMIMDAKEVSSRGRPKVYFGACAATADTLKWCVAAPGKRRPSSFESKGNDQFLLILKKQP